MKWTPAARASALLPVLLIGAVFAPRTDTPAAAAPATCESRPVGSRWLPQEARYEATHLYGLDMEEWIGSVGGIAYREDKLFFLDLGDPRVVVLSRDLTTQAQFGRIGEGPGEFERPLVPWAHRSAWTFWYLAVTNEQIIAYDREAIEVFDHGGQFLTRASGLPRDPLFGVRFVSGSPDGERLYYALDAVSRVDRGGRSLETWSQTDGGRELVWSVPLPDPPHTGAGYVLPARQARPLWVHGRGCFLVSDGASDRLLRFDLADGVERALPLPEWEVPGVGARERALGRSRVRAGLPGADLAPTALARWTDLAVDPDGFVWVELWREDRAAAARVAVLDLQGRLVAEVTVPSFPKAFADPGTYFGVDYIDDTGQSVIVRYELEGS